MTSEARLESERWRITFERRGDRYGHVVESIAAAKATPLLESVEGTPDKAWPASPALKELHFEQRPDGKQLALLVGMAGRSHWSLSVELDRIAEQLVFDVACRLCDEPQQLASSYRILSPTESLANDSDRTILPCGLVLQPQAVEQQLADMTLASPELLVIRPFMGSGKYPRTVRWRYAIGPANLG